ncbi:MAG: hypothetical protein JRN39_02525 [Nitrososphaerota archaeon]|nr:hypothetical protein [Nitrososphaerota archaeon]
MSGIAMATLGTLAGLGATAAATGDASTLAQSVSQMAPHGLQVALAHVPTWTQAHAVLAQHLQLYAQNGGAGGAGASAAGAAIKKGLAHMARPR